MKKNIVSLVFVILLAQIASAAVVDAPHNTISCVTCHSYSLWWQYSPSSQSPAPNDHTAIVDAVCMVCHKDTAGLPQASTHSSTVVGSNLHGVWGVGCTDCHNPHYQDQLNWVGSASTPYLVTGTISSVTYDTGLDQSIISYADATENPKWPADNALSTGPDWGNKSLTNPNRGLILVHDSEKALNTFSIIAATPSQVIIQGELSPDAVDPTFINPQTHIQNSATSNTFGLIYGQLVKDRIAAKPVKFFDPTGGFVEAGANTSGICQVCHTQTSHFTNSGVLPSGADSHIGRETGNCITCHQHQAGFKGNGHDNSSFAWAGNCRTCHDPNTTVQSIASEIHGSSCGLCHVALGGGGPRKDGDAANGIDGSALQASNSSTCVDCHLTTLALSAADIHHQSVNGYAAAGNCTQCHQDAPGRLAADHGGLVRTDNACNSCHTATAGTTAGVSVNDADNKVHDQCTTCHQTNGQLMAAYGLASAIPSGGGTCTDCHGSYFSSHSHSHGLAVATSCMDCHSAVAPPFIATGQVHAKLGCQTCHDATSGQRISLAAGKTAGANCQTCHLTGHATTTDHNHRQPVATCGVCHAIATPGEIDTLHHDCLTCHAYTGAKLDPSTVANAIATGKGVDGTDVTCQTCHTYNGHHDRPEAANNDCTTTCHTAVDHSATVAADTACASCHTATAGTANGMPVSPSAAAIHDACRTCHTFDANRRGILVEFTNQKGVDGSGALPTGGTCVTCHTAVPSSAYHHTSPRTAVGQCETCHVDPRPEWGPNSPGDNGSASGLAQARPTQMACRKCHVAFTGSTMRVTKFERTGYTSYRYNWTKTTAHTIPMTGNSINNYGICLSCHHQGSTKVPSSAWVSLWHAHPSRFGGSAWTFYDQGYDKYQGKTLWRGSGSYSDSPPGDWAHYIPGRSKHDPADLAPQSGISGFNIFAPNYGQPYRPLAARQGGGDNPSSGEGMDANAFLAPAYDTPAFTRVAVPTTAQIGDPASELLGATTRSVPVFASFQPKTIPSSATDTIKVTSAIYDSDLSSLTVTASTSSSCASLKTVYGGNEASMSGTPAHCTVTINNPAYPADGTTVDVATTNPLGLNVLGYRIAAPNPGTIAFSAASSSAAESEGMATIIVSRTGGSTGQVSVDYTTVDGTATAGNDYLASSGTLTWQDGETDKSFTIAILADASPETTETVRLELSTPTGGAIIGRPGTAQLDIADDDLVAGALTLSAPTYTVTEDAGAVTITVSRTGSATGAVSVDYTTNPFGSTARAGINYETTAGTLVWGDGDASGKSFTIPILRDPLASQSTTLNLYIHNASGGASLGPQSTAQVSITTPASVAVLDDWPATPQLTVMTGGMSEPTRSLSGTFTISPGNNRLLLVAISSSFNYGPANTGQTFTASYGGKPLTQASLENSTRYQTWIGYLQEADIASRSGDEVAVTVNGSTTGVAAFIASYQNVNQARPIFANGGNNWSSSYVNFVSSPLVVGPGGYAIYNWSINPADTLTLPANHTESYARKADFHNTTINCGMASRRFLSATNTNPTMPSYTILYNADYNWIYSTTGASTGITLNPSAGPVAVTMNSATYSEKESAGVATITVSRPGSASGPVSVDYATTDGTATAGPDYTATSGTLTWEDGDVADKVFTIPLVNDLAAEGDKTVNLTLSSPTGAILGSNDTAVLTIIDEISILAFSTSIQSVIENAGTATITVTRTGLAVGAVTVNYARYGGTAVAGSDYDYATTSGTLSWADDDMAPKTITIGIIDDSLVESSYDSVYLRLSTPTGNAVLGEINTTLLYITNDDTNIAFQTSTPSVSESAGTITIYVNRNGEATEEVSVHYTTTDDMALADADYTPVDGTLTWGPGDMASKLFTIAIVNDSLAEGNETVNLTLTAPTGGATLGPKDTAVLTITDNDSNLAFTASAYSVNESDGTVTITVTRTGLTTSPATVHYATADGTATAGSDYTATSGDLTWGFPDAAPKSFTIPILSDSLVEGDETVTLTLTAPTGNASLVDPNTAVLTIVDQ